MFSPLEQFLVISIFSFFNITVTNESCFVFLIILISFFFLYAVRQKRTQSFFIIVGNWQYFLQKVYDFLLFTTLKNTNNFRGQKFFPLVFSIFFSILLLNLIGLVPNSFAVTSHLVVTFGLSLCLFIGTTTVCIIKHKDEFFNLFLPKGTSFVLSLLLIPIEVISYFFKPLSLAIRLFANLMAGHALMHVIAGFGYIFMESRGIAYFVQYVPVIIILFLFLLAVCTIQAFVFSILICLYLNDALNLH